MTRFNPTLVRLRWEARWIKKSGEARFNPTLVRLRRLRLHDLLSARKRFNPTLVRLRPVGGFRIEVVLVFQSHAGSIEDLHFCRTKSL